MTIDPCTGFAMKTGRALKALKVEAVLKHYLVSASIEGMAILDIGCGSGVIAQYFSWKNQVVCVDIQNNMLPEIASDIDFKIVHSSALPFRDGQFDIVISNHIIEHLADQETHLKEIYRVLKRHGVCYFAAPNASFPIEPHYKIPLIHYLPGNSFDGLLKLLKKYREAIYLLNYRKMLVLFAGMNFNATDYTSIVLKDPVGFSLEIKITRFLPLWLLKCLSCFMPTNIFVLAKVQSQG